MPLLKIARSILPPLEWGRGYSSEAFQSDLIAGVVTLFITVPAAMAYAFLAGVPPQIGLYASMASLFMYGIFGGSRAMSIGPAAIISIMTLGALATHATPFSHAYVLLTEKLAFIIGVLLVLLRIVNFGAVISFLSHAVVVGFLSAAAILILVNQIPLVLGFPTPSNTSVVAIFELFIKHLGHINYTSAAIWACGVLLLLFCKFWLQGILVRTGMGEKWAGNIVKSAPMFVVALSTVAVYAFGFSHVEHVPVVGNVPTKLPSLHMVSLSFEQVRQLAPSAFLIAMVVFMENMSIAAAMASKRREKVDSNQELIAAGATNIGASLIGALPVAGSFGRTAVNFSAGSVSPFASMVTGLLVIVTVIWFAPFFYYLPKAALSAIIAVSAAQLIDVPAIRKILSFSPSDSVTFAFTFFTVLFFGVEKGILTGIAISFVILIRASSKPHIAVVGRWKDTEHFRNILRHEVQTVASVLTIRVDESLYFVNARYIEEFVFNRVAESREIKHVVLICTATNFIDSAGLEMLEQLHDTLKEVGVTLHLSEVKSPVMDRLKATDFYKSMQGEVYFTTDIAMKELVSPDA